MVLRQGKQAVVVPLVGTWIEIVRTALISNSQNVVPLVGTWIEILVHQIQFEYIQSFLS